MGSHLERYSQKNLRDGKPPAIADYVRAAVHPAEASNELRDFMDENPEFAQTCRYLAAELLGIRPQS